MATSIGDGITIEDATQASVDWVCAHYREGEKFEAMIAKGECSCDIAQFDNCVIIRYHGDIIGYCGVKREPEDTMLSHVRYLCFMSTTNVWKCRKAFVRHSRKVMKHLVDRLPPWVSEIRSIPAAGYAGSVIWHERVLGMKRVGEVFVNGYRLYIYSINRNEVK